MRAIDTNIVVRLVVRDDPDQYAMAKALLSGGNTLILPTVLLEAEWVLRSRYKLGRRRIAEGLGDVCGLDGVSVLSADAVAATITRYAQAGDFADLLHLALAEEANAATFTTFDRDMSGWLGSRIVLETLQA